MSTAECRSCHAPVDWAMSEDGTKRNPIDHTHPQTIRRATQHRRSR